MQRSQGAATLATLLVLTVGPACAGPSGLVTSPTAIQSHSAPAPPDLPAISGRITLTSATPPSGATVEVYDCDPSRSLGRSRPHHVVGLCNQQIRITFDVVVDRDLPDAYVAVEFIGERGQCGVAWTTPTSVFAGRETSVAVEAIVFSDDPNVSVHCVLPANTTRLIASLRAKTFGDRVLMAQEFAQAYTFVMR